jgi:hypothetical protein
VVQGSLSLQTRPAWTVQVPVAGLQRFSPHVPGGRVAEQVTGFVAVQTQTPLATVGMKVAHLLVVLQTTGVVMHCPLIQLTGRQGLVETQFVQVVELHPGIGVWTHCPLVALQESIVHALPSSHLIGEKTHPTLGLQAAVWQVSGGVQETWEVDEQVLVVGLQTFCWQRLEGWLAQVIAGLVTHFWATTSQTEMTQGLVEAGQVIGVKLHCPVNGLQVSFVHGFPSLQKTVWFLMHPLIGSQMMVEHLSAVKEQVTWVLTHCPVWALQESVVQTFPSSQVLLVVTHPTFASQVMVRQLKAAGFAL